MADENKEAESKKFPREGKLYALKNSAQRAAKEDGLIPGQFEVVEQKKGKEVKFFYKVSDAHRAVAEQMAEQKKAEPPKPEPKKVTCPHCSNVYKDTDHGSAEQHLATHIEKKHPVVEDAPKKELKVVDMHDPEQKAQYEKENVPPPSTTFAPTGDVKSATSGGPTRVVTGSAPKGAPVTKIPKWASGANRSQVESPTKAVWHIAEELTTANPGISRKAVIEECVRRGIAYYTARTQFQQWLTAKRESDANAAKANGNKKK